MRQLERMGCGDSARSVVGGVEPTDALVQIAFTVMEVLTRVAADYDLSLTQLRVFGILRDRTPRMAQLADFLGLEKSTMSGLISRAEERGMLMRRPSADDARVAEVVMTEAGLAIATRVEDSLRAELAPVVSQLNQPEIKLLERLTQFLQSRVKP